MYVRRLRNEYGERESVIVRAKRGGNRSLEKRGGEERRGEERR
jgi:hypothetical protein